MLEPCEGKLSRTVRRGERGGNAPALPGSRTMDGTPCTVARVSTVALLLALAATCTTAAGAALLLYSSFVDECCDQDYISLYRSSFLWYVAGTGGALSLVSVVAIMALPIRRLTQFAIASGTIVGLGCAAICFSFLFTLSAFPAVGQVPSCYLFQPWWRARNCILVLCVLGVSGGFTAWTVIDTALWIQAHRLLRRKNSA